MEEIFDIGDLGQVEFIPKHLSGEIANIKAGRDAYRAREIVVDSPPVNAVTTIPRKSDEVGIVIVGITGSATGDSIKIALRKWASNVSFMEVNTNYKRTIDDHKGRSAFVFFDNVKDINEVIGNLRQWIPADDPGVTKVAKDAYVTEIPSSQTLNDYRNPEQRENKQQNKAGFTSTSNLIKGMIQALGKAHGAKLTRKKHQSIYLVKQDLEKMLQTLVYCYDQGVDQTTFGIQSLQLRESSLEKCRDVVDMLGKKDLLLPEVQDLLTCIK